MMAFTWARHFCVTYRWELWLLVWAPLLGSVASSVASILFAVFYDIGWLTGYYVYGYGGLGSLLEAALLLALYARVRRLGRRYLSLVWGYAIAIEGVAVLAWLVGVALGPSYESSNFGATFLLLTGPSLVQGTASLAVLLVFARQASRFSLVHAFFLFLLFKGYHLPSAISVLIATQLRDLFSLGESRATVALIAWPFDLVGTAAIASVLAWLLGNFESRGVSFRNRAVLGLLVASVAYLLWTLAELVIEGVPGLLGLLGVVGVFLSAGLLTLLLPLALIYLVRVRNPGSPVDAEPPTDLRVQ